MEVVLRVLSGPHKGQEILFSDAGAYRIGRSVGLPLSLPEDRLLSREHFQIELNPPLCDLQDLESTNGTKVNGLRVERARLRDGDCIEVGNTSIAVEMAETIQDDGLPRLRCPGCGEPAPADLPRTVGMASWLCPACEASRKQFPQTHPEYLIERKLGSGGMGDVYLARELTTNRPVAIKMMVSTAGASERANEYFRREMTVLRDLLMPGGRCHQSIVAFYDIFRVEGSFQLVMEYVPGKNALELLTGHADPLPYSVAACIGVRLLSALQHAHERGYVHRDVKPSNLLIHGPAARPKVKLSDFGLAKSFRENSGFAALTRQGDVGGSVGFISPDHIRGFGEVKAAADIYSAGATLYYLLTRHYPFLNFDPYSADAYAQILENPPVPLRAYRPSAPEGLERILARSLAKQPQARWKSAQAMSEALEPYCEVLTTPGRT